MFDFTEVIKDIMWNIILVSHLTNITESVIDFIFMIII